MRCDTTQVLPEYVAYYFGSHAGQYQLLANSAQIGVPSIARPSTYLRELSIPIPPITEQRKITEHLSALDDKIELNRRMNATLEAMARALFQSWFVDFDPVRAKAAGRQPVGMDAETAALFPDSFEDSALGPIPKGWGVGTFGEIAKDSESRVKASAITPSTNYVALDDMPRRRISLDQWGNADTVASATTPFKRGDILFGKLRPYFHKVVVAPVSGVCSTEILVISPTRDEWFGLVLGHAMSDALVSHASRVSNGTKMPRCKWGDLSNYAIAIPPLHIAKIAAETILEMTLAVRVNTHNARTTAKAREALLPMLLSGELRVGDVAA
jgi:type I restriction enzyme S subunit